MGWFERHGIPHGAAVGASFLGAMAVTLGLTWVFADALFGNLGTVGADISRGADQVVGWLHDHNAWFKEQAKDVRDFLSSILPAARSAADGVVAVLVGGLSLAAQLISGVVLMFVLLLYLLTGGDAVWRWIQGRFSADHADRVAGAGVAAWRAATGYVRGIALVALIDTTVITLGMTVIGTPHRGVLALLSFLTLFVPIRGAWVSGTVIVLVTLSAVGTGAAVAMALTILVAQQLDSMFVTPLVHQQTVSLHPIVTLSGVIVGSQLFGIVGAFLAVPMIAVGWAVYKALEQPAAGSALPPEPAVSMRTGPWAPCPARARSVDVVGAALSALAMGGLVVGPRLASGR